LKELVLYERARSALAAAKRSDEVKKIIDVARAIKAAAHIAKNQDLEADAMALRMRAELRLGELIEAQKRTVGLNKGAAGGGTKASPRGPFTDPRDKRPTLREAGIDKHLAQRARTAVIAEEREPGNIEKVIAATKAKMLSPHSLRPRVHPPKNQWRQIYDPLIKASDMIDASVALAKKNKECLSPVQLEQLAEVASILEEGWNSLRAVVGNSSHKANVTALRIVSGGSDDGITDPNATLARGSDGDG
jgi:hypothetical protein